LLEAEGWSLFEETVLASASSRAEAILMRPGLKVREQEYLKGEMSGMLFALKLARESVEVGEAALKLLLEDERNERSGE